MTQAAKRIFERALDLSPDDRAQLADRLLKSLEGADEAAIAEAWDAEAARRADQIDTGAVRAIPWDEAERLIFGELDAASQAGRISS